MFAILFFAMASFHVTLQISLLTLRFPSKGLITDPATDLRGSLELEGLQRAIAVGF